MTTQQNENDDDDELSLFDAIKDLDDELSFEAWSF